METVNQPTNNPTNKLASGTLGTAASGFAFLLSGLIVRNLAPSWYDAEVWMSGQVFIMTAGTYISGYYRKDKPNVVVQVSQ